MRNHFLKILSVFMMMITSVLIHAQSTSSGGSNSNPRPPSSTVGGSSAQSGSASANSGSNGPARVAPDTQDPITIYKTTNASQGVNAAPQPGKYSYVTVPDDPTRTRIYTLSNGLKVYLSQNKAEPRVQTYIAVKAGSKNDPRETTGLAHYLEHMMFKGTADYGTTDYQREKLVLDALAQLYEKQRMEKDPEKKKAIYVEIDKMSQQAAKFAIPNEYDKMISSLGAKGTNAYTSKEQTVYVNDIPANEIEKWLVVESDRFRQCVLRLFPTELEAVYEEYNMGQDRDGTKMNEAYYRALFPTHPYGTQTTIGEGEHLKNPSMLNIMSYFYTFYVPNNMAICLSGDIDYDKTIALIDKYFGNYLNKPLGEMKFPQEKPITEIQKREVFGHEAASMEMGYRLPGANTKESTIAKLVAGMLFNQQAGLIDLDLNQQQKVLDAAAYYTEWKEYGVFTLAADPRDGQSLEDCEKLLLEEIDKLRKGEFDDWMIKAVVNDNRLSRIKSFESNNGRASAFVSAFVKGIDWGAYLHEYDAMEKITKQEVIDFVNKYLGTNNYVVIYKRKGDDPNVKKVEKPAITPIEANREAQSKFTKDFLELPSSRVQPEFVDFKSKINTVNLSSGIPFGYVHNDEDQLFELYYILDMGSDNDELMEIAVNYLPYLGTDKYTAAELQEEFFKYGLTFNVSAGRDRIYVSLNGLETNLDKGVELFEQLLNNVKPDPKAYNEMVDGMMKERADAKTNKNAIFNSAMYSYARWGSFSPATDIMSESDLRNITPQQLVDKIKSIETYKHRVFYYGQKSQEEVKTIIDKYHHIPATLADYPMAKKYPELATKTNKVLFVDYPMVQAQIMFVSKDDNFNAALLPEARLFNEYFGSGLSSIVFQEIRETKALAYSAFAQYTVPNSKDEAHYVRAFVGTQADKMPQAITAMKEILNAMPQADEQFKSSVESVEKQIESERIIRSNIFWTNESNRRKGLDYDYRRDIYLQLRGMTMDDLQKFFDDHIANRTYTILVLGDSSKLDMLYLQSLGEFTQLSLEDIFGY